MKTLIIYDTQGYILSNIAGSYRVPNGVPFLETEIPEGKRIKYVDGVGVDVSSSNPKEHFVILEDIPPSETEVLKQQMATQEQAIADLTMYISML